MTYNLNPLYDLIRADGSIVLNKNLCHAIGTNEAIVYSELLSRYNYFNTREELDQEGFFYNTVDDLQIGTTLGEKPQKAAIKKLIKLGLIKYKVKGMPQKRYFKIVDDTSIICNLLEEGIKNVEGLKQKQAERKEKSQLRPNGGNAQYRPMGGNDTAQMEELIPPDGSVNNTNTIIQTNNTNNSAIKDYTSKLEDKIDYISLSEEVWKLYPCKKEKKKSIPKIISILKDKKKGYDFLVKCIERYVADVEARRRNGFKTLEYQNGLRFFSSTYEDYMDENFILPTENNNNWRF